MRTLLHLEELGNNCFNRESYVTVISRNKTDSEASSMGTLIPLFSVAQGLRRGGTVDWLESL